MNTHAWFPLGLTRLISLQPKELLKSLLQYHSSKASVPQNSAFFIVQLSHPYMTTGNTIALTRWSFVGKVMSLLFNMLYGLVIAFLPRSKHLLISWLHLPSVVTLEGKKISFHCFHWSYWTGCHGLGFLNVEFYASFFTRLFRFYQEALWLFFAFCHKGGVICISKVIDTSGNLHSSFCFIQPRISHDALCISVK